MDWVHIYYACLLAISFTFDLLKHGEPRGREHSIFISLAAVVLHMPMIGRIWGWW